MNELLVEQGGAETDLTKAENPFQYSQPHAVRQWKPINIDRLRHYHQDEPSCDGPCTDAS